MMPDWLAGLPLPDMALGTLVVVVCLRFAQTTIGSILEGQLVPKSYIDAAQKERDDWRDIALAEQSISRKLGVQLERLLVGVDGARHVVDSLPRPHPDQGNDHDPAAS